MSPRPAPKYGEYATPEEVREALGQPAPPHPSHRIDDSTLGGAGSPVSPSVVPAGPVRSPAAEPRADVSAAPATAPTSELSPANARLTNRRRWDQLVTVTLLVMGAWNLIFGTPSLIAFDQSMRSYFADVPGMPEATFTEPTRLIGQLMAAVLIIVFAAAVWFAWRRLRASKSAFWIPLLGGAVTLLVMFAGVAAMILLEPGLYEALAAMQASNS